MNGKPEKAAHPWAAATTKGLKMESGIYSFGPLWTKAVCEVRPIALNPANREKLNTHGAHLGIEHPDKMDAPKLCGAIAERTKNSPH